MSKYDIEINLESIDSAISNMDKDLSKLEEEMTNINKAYSFLDESRWIGRDKKQIDNGFGLYLQKMSNFSNDLRSTLNVIKEAYSKYGDVEKTQDKLIQELEDL